MKTTEIKRGQFNAYYPISNLKMAKVNRDVLLKHSENFKEKLNEFGWMMPIVISSDGDIIEGHHRVVSSRLLKQTTVPAYIVDWVDTNKGKEHLNAIISLNNGNKAWTTLDYLKAFSKDNDQYSKVYDAFLKNRNNVSAGNVVNSFFGRESKNFKKGKSTIKDEKFSLYLLEKISNLVNDYGKSNVQAYCVREMINIGFSKAFQDYKAMDYLFTEYGRLAKLEHPAATSISRFKPLMEVELKHFYKK